MGSLFEKYPNVYLIVDHKCVHYKMRCAVVCVRENGENLFKILNDIEEYAGVAK